MSRRRPIDEIASDEPLVGLNLPVPERDVIVTCKHVADGSLQNRVQSASVREVISFTMEELEDLHRGLAFDANQTPDKKREKTIKKVLRKIEEVLNDDSDFDAFDFPLGKLDDEFTLPQSPQQIFDTFFRGSSSDAPVSPPCDVVLSASQRETLRGMDTISLDIHKMFAVESQDELPFKLNSRQFMVTCLAIKEAIALARTDAVAKPFMEIAQRISEGLFAAIENSAALDGKQGYSRSQGNATNLAFQLKITLEGSKPPIWRRVLVADCTLDVLHQVIQMAMGWTNSHMHQFEYGEDRFSDPHFEIGIDGDHYDEMQVFLSQLVADGCQKLRYCYDFGDDWWHTIKIEKLVEPKPADKFPICVKGAGACPPEDCGGIWGYYDFLEAVHDPMHERHDEVVEWAGDDFDPNDFDIEETNAALAEGPVGGFEL